MTLKKLLAIGFCTFLLVGCVPAEEIDSAEDSENEVTEESSQVEEEIAEDEQTCFVMGDGECYEPGEVVADTDCTVNEEGECTPLDESVADDEEAVTEDSTKPECFVMFDGNCYKPGETVPDTGCKVNEEGACTPMDQL